MQIQLSQIAAVPAALIDETQVGEADAQLFELLLPTPSPMPATPEELVDPEAEAGSADEMPIPVPSPLEPEAPSARTPKESAAPEPSLDDVARTRSQVPAVAKAVAPVESPMPMPDTPVTSPIEALPVDAIDSIAPAPPGTSVPAAPSASTAAHAIEATPVFEQIRVAVRPGKSQVVIRLEPEELGRLDIQFTIKRGRMEGSITAENSTVARLLESQMGRLFTSMEESGIHVDTFEVRARTDAEADASGHETAKSLTPEDEGNGDSTDPREIVEVAAEVVSLQLLDVTV